MPSKTILGLTAAGLLTLAAAPAFAGTGGERRDERDEAAAAATAPVTLGQAISAAEGSTGGRAFQAGYESRDGTLVVQVDLVKDQARLETRVDAASGKVIATGDLENGTHGDGHEGEGEGDDD
jgi:uncharacterized membrane protein YkoI